MRHSEFREWASVALGDPRQVYARDRGASDDAPLVFMPDGEALRFRPAARTGALVCPVPGCPSPGLTTRGSDSRRHHFMHVHAPADPAHSRSYARLATRRLLREWAAAQDHVVDALEDAELDGVPVAVLAQLDDESEVALCYVDTKLGADAWQERNAALRAQGLATS